MGKKRQKSSERRPGGRPLAKEKRPRWPLFLLLLALLTSATFWRVRENQFLNYDDPEYVTGNETVRQGLSWEGVVWAFTTNQAANWHPLTWLTHMADVSLYGMNPAGHHTTNLLLHVANTILLFLVLRRLTGAEARSACVAAFFAVHPAHVESVAWVAERKDLLSALFWFLTTGAYVSWVRKGGAVRYALVLLGFAAGLLSKPMLVSLPLTLVLLDAWPLGRLGGGGGETDSARSWRPSLAARVLEKTPLFLMAAASSVVTFLVQRAGGAVRTFEAFPFWTRVGNAFVAYAEYLRILVWPAGLGVLYPHPGKSLSFGKVAAAALLLAALSVAAVLLRRGAPYLLVGWLWFLITLVPVIGIVQVGFQALADRYTYVPYVGLFVAIVWGVSAIASARRWPGTALAALAAAAVLALELATAAQVRRWKDSESIYLHTLGVTKDNSTIRNNLGDYYNDNGRPAEALPHLSEAMRIKPEAPEIHINLGRSFFLLSRIDEAAQQFAEALRLKPKEAVAFNNLARARFVQGDVPGAIRFYRASNALVQSVADLHMRVGLALLVEGKNAAGRRELELAAGFAPSDPSYRRLGDGVGALDRGPSDTSSRELRRALSGAHQEVGAGLQAAGKKAEALSHFRKAVELFPGVAGPHLDLGALLTEENRWDEARAEFEAAVRADPGSALAHTDLGYAFFHEGRREAAIEQYREALRLAPGFPLAQSNLDQALRQTPAGESKQP